MVINPHQERVSRQRRAGVILHPTSLPGPMPQGDIGHQAYRFIEFLHTHGFKVWQMLPLGPTHEDKSPYQCLSSHAGNPLLISLDWLVDKGWLDESTIKTDKSDAQYRSTCLQQAGQNFYATQNTQWHTRLTEFIEQHAAWLDDYALFMAFKERQENIPWYEWPEEIRHRDADALSKAKEELHELIRQTEFEQFIFFTQWQEISRYAKSFNIELFGDMPIFVAHDSADAWAERENFLIDAHGHMELVAGVPPDAFSETGQRWGNPLYNWEYMQKSNFSWWKKRFTTQLELFDLVRIDHFRGLHACWEIPAQDDTAINGRWVEVPGRQLLQALFDEFDDLPLIAEDLGVITDSVIALKQEFALPGMKVLQFAFDGSNANPHLPHNHDPHDVIYTGTHDNNTTLGWLIDETNYNKEYMQSYINQNWASPAQGAWMMIRTAMASVSFLCVLPMQDLLKLDSSARMNTPGTVEGNWQWRLDWQQVSPQLKEQLTQLMTLYQR